MPFTGATISGPPQRLDIRASTRNAIFAVGKSSASLAKCSMVDMTVSKIDWFAMRMLVKMIERGILEGEDEAYSC